MESSEEKTDADLQSQV